MGSQPSENVKKVKNIVVLAGYLWLAPHLMVSYQHTVGSDKGVYTDRHELSLRFESEKKLKEVKNGGAL